MIKMITFGLVVLLYFAACSDEDMVLSTSTNNMQDNQPADSSNTDSTNTNTTNDYNWLIPVDDVYDGGPGKDGIPALRNPELINADEADYLENSDLVLGIVSGNDIVAYPHRILDWHEIINADLDGIRVAVNYCPLTGTGIGWDRFVNGSYTTFGVSGLLYNSNLILYDRGSDSNWSQIRLDCVYGELAGTKAKTHSLIETTWETWKIMYPNTKVVSTNTGYSRNYNRYPYGDYKNSEALFFPVDPLDERLHLKERVHGLIINDKAKVYRFSSFSSSNNIIVDQFEGEDLIIAGNVEKNFIISFVNTIDNSLQFNSLENKLPVIMIDNEGNRWNIWGEAVEGPRTGEKLTPTQSFMGYWFAWGAFYPNALIYD